MSGFSINVSFDDVQVDAAYTRLQDFGETRQAGLMEAVGNYGVTSTVLRFQRQAGPDGKPWKPSKRAIKTGGKTLQLRGYLVGSIVYNLIAGGVEWGSGLVYALIHQLGGTIKSHARQQDVFRKVERDGGLSASFVKRKHANFMQSITIPEFQIKMPARPYVGIDHEDEREIASLGARHLQAALLGNTAAALRGGA